MNTREIPVKTIERLILYKRILSFLLDEGQEFIFSHRLAALANNTPAQVRRDLMLISSTGSSGKGYKIKELTAKIESLLAGRQPYKIALAGIGNLGRALLSFFSYRQPNLEIAAAFDADESKTGRVISGCRCYHVNEMSGQIEKLDILLGIIAVPAVHAQETADIMVEAGIKGILNFAPVPIRTPADVTVDGLDITMTLEKLAFLADR